MAISHFGSSVQCLQLITDRSIPFANISRKHNHICKFESKNGKSICFVTILNYHDNVLYATTSALVTLTSKHTDRYMIHFL